MSTESNFTCDEILKLIRASKTFNLHLIRIGDLEIRRVGDSTSDAITQPPADKTPGEKETLSMVDKELTEYDKENLLISDPLEYEKQLGNG